MTTEHGFELLTEQRIHELETTARLYRHRKTGAELLSFINGDENKVFGITFRTPPKDSNGVPHILEHSVLCGSRKYPVKEPFVELLKGSLQTFLNAFTFPDKTCYPVASQNIQDFYNLIDVYLDAVFYPRLTPHILQQEGWHLEADDADKPFSYKGVVFNEMKGSYSSPDRALAEYSQQAVFPDITYGLDSGGHPREIPNLTFEQFKRFHETYYHPTNARIYFYGDDSPGKRLEIVNDYLKDFDRRAIDSGIPLQPRFDGPQKVVKPIAVGRSDDANGKGMITVNWMLDESSDTDSALALSVIEYMLLGMPASPLRKALIDSGLGEDLAGIGLEDGLRQMYFSTGLKGINVENAGKVEELIMDTLKGLSKNGIHPHTVEAAINSIEFRLRENNTGHFPRGLLLMLRALSTWLYDGDPLARIGFESNLNRLKSNIDSDNRYFEKLLERFFLDNLHRVTVILKPDPELGEKEDKEELQRLDRLKSGMAPDQVQAVIDNTVRLKELQEAPDSPEALAAIPTLKLADLPRKNKLIPSEELSRDGTRMLYHDLATNSISYLDLGFDLHGLEPDHLPFAGLFGRALLEMGTETEDFVTFSQRISRKTGGIRRTFFTSQVKDADRTTSWLFLRCKAVVDRTQDLLDILADALLTVKLDDRERFRKMTLEAKARVEETLVSSGHQLVSLRLRSRFSEAGWAAEQMHGVSYLIFLRSLLNRIDNDWPGVLSTLENMRQILVNRNTMLLNATVDKDNWTTVKHRLDDFCDRIPAAPAKSPAWPPDRTMDNEGLAVPTQVNYVGKGVRLYDTGYRFHGSALVIMRYLRNSWLWQQVRVQGGAYGAFCSLDRLSGSLVFVSYRDPNIRKTLEAFDRTAEYLRTAHISENELTKAIIGAIGDIDEYLLPDAKGYSSMVRTLAGDTRESRQAIRDEVLGTTVEHFRAFADAIEVLTQQGLVSVIASERALEEATEDRPEWLKVTSIL